MVQDERYRALIHDSDAAHPCTLGYFPEELKDITNTWYDNPRHKKSSIIQDYNRL
jgi:hypothetical protein